MMETCPVCGQAFDAGSYGGIRLIACRSCLSRMPHFMVTQLRQAIDAAREHVATEPRQVGIPADPLELEQQEIIDDYQGHMPLSAHHAEVWGYHDDCGDR